MQTPATAGKSLKPEETREKNDLRFIVRLPYEQKPNKKRTVKNQRSLQCVSVDDIGLENLDESNGNPTIVEKLTPNPTLSAIERHLLSLFRQRSGLRHNL